jgi:hypothetical protein
VKKDSGTQLTLKITPTLAETVPLWAKKIEPVVENVDAILKDDSSMDKKEASLSFVQSVAESQKTA